MGTEDIEDKERWEQRRWKERWEQSKWRKTNEETGEMETEKMEEGN